MTNSEKADLIVGLQQKALSQQPFTNDDNLGLLSMRDDEDALDLLVSGNQGLVQASLKAYRRKYPSVDYDELYSVANRGLWNAIRQYDVTRKVRFSTFAMNHISYAIRDYGKKEYAYRGTNLTRVLSMDHTLFEDDDDAPWDIADPEAMTPEEASDYDLATEAVLSAIESDGLTGREKLMTKSYLGIGEDRIRKYHSLALRHHTTDDIAKRALKNGLEKLQRDEKLQAIADDLQFHFAEKTEKEHYFSVLPRFQSPALYN